MTKYMRYFFRAMALTSLIAGKLPGYLEDGKITVAEMTEFITEVLKIGGWKAHIEVPTALGAKPLNLKAE